MSVQHIPGPWQWFPDGGTSGKVTYGPDYADCVWGPKGPGYGVVADCSPHGMANEETIANARLIAAAPDLLEALEALLDSQHGLNLEAWKEAVARGHAAIAKATGGEHP